MNKKIFIILAVLFAGTCAFLFNLFYTEAKDAAIAKLNEEQMIHARQAARGLEDFFATWTSTLNSLAKMDEIVAADAVGQRDLQRFYEAHQDHIRAVTRLDENGVILCNFPVTSSAGADLSGQKHVAELLRDRRPVVGDVFRAVEGFDAVALHVPVFKAGVFKGSVGILIDFQSLAQRYLEMIKIGQTGYAWVVSPDGTLLYTPIAGFVGKSSLETSKDFPDLRAVINDMIKGHEGFATYTYDRIGDRYVGPTTKYAAYLPVHVGQTFWSVAVASSEQDVLAGLVTFRNKLALVVAALFICGLVLSIIGARAWFLVREQEKRHRVETKLQQTEQAQESLRHTADELARSNKDLEAFAYLASHDLQAPLRQVTGMMSFLRSRYHGRLDAKADECINIAVNGAAQMSALISDLLTYSRVGEPDLKFQNINLQEPVYRALRLLRPDLDAAGATVAVPDLPMAQAHPGELAQVFQNLIGNAVKFRSDHPPEIEVGAKCDDGQCLVWVKDNGIGLDPAHGQQIFELFRRLHDPSKYPGTGLGLAICKKIVQRHGGRIWVESAPGQGSTFFFTLAAHQ